MLVPLLARASSSESYLPSQTSQSCLKGPSKYPNDLFLSEHEESHPESPQRVCLKNYLADGSDFEQLLWAHLVEPSVPRVYTCKSQEQVQENSRATTPFARKRIEQSDYGRAEVGTPPAAMPSKKLTCQCSNFRRPSRVVIKCRRIAWLFSDNCPTFQLPRWSHFTRKPGSSFMTRRSFKSPTMIAWNFRLFLVATSFRFIRCCMSRSIWLSLTASWVSKPAPITARSVSWPSTRIDTVCKSTALLGFCWDMPARSWMRRVIALKHRSLGANQ